MAEERGAKEGTTLSDVAAVVRRRWALIALCFIVVVGASIAFSLVREKEYSASTSLLFRDPEFDTTLFGSTFAPALDPARESATNVELVSLDIVAARTASELGDLTPAEVEDKIEIEEQGQSDVVEITATDPDPDRAAEIANTLAREYIDFRQAADREKVEQARELVEDELAEVEASGGSERELSELQRQIDSLTVLASLQTGNAELVQPAQPPRSPSSPKPVRNGLLGAFVGLLLGFGLAFIVDRFDRRLRDPDEVGETLDRPVLGLIPESDWIGAGRSKQTEMPVLEIESFRSVRANLRYFNIDREVKSVLITSALPGDGKTTIAWNVAAAGAGVGVRTLLIEADLRRPMLAQRLGVDPTRGLSRVLAGRASLHDEVTQAPVVDSTNGAGEPRYLDVLLAGALPPNPADMIESEHMRALISEAERSYDAVFIDTPPTSLVSDAIPLMGEVDGVIVVVRLGNSTRAALERLRDQLTNLGAPTLGVVINSMPERRAYGYYRGYASPVAGRARAD
jgi:capsular exopolysaccharide synthesis family protein